MNFLPLLLLYTSVGYSQVWSQQHTCGHIMLNIGLETSIHRLLDDGSHITQYHNIWHYRP